MDDFAIVVGISRYPNLDPLQGPEADAQDFFDWVTHAAGGGVKPTNAKLILSSNFPVPPEANRPQPAEHVIEDELETLWARGQAEGQFGRRLYLFFAGHGVSPAGDGVATLDDAGLLTANAASGRLHHVGGRVFADLFRTAAYFREIVLFMDCCREQARFVRLSRPPWNPNSSGTPARVCYVFSTGWNKTSREAAWLAGGPVRGLFSLALTNTLRAGNGTGRLTTADLKGLLYAEMRRIAEGAAKAAAVAGVDASVVADQDPKWYLDDGLDPIVFAAAPRAATVRVRLSPAFAGQPVRLVDGALQPVRETSHTDTVWEWSIPSPGLYAVKAGATSQPIEIANLAEAYDVNL
jgi:uncharacterized caspase-like protein